MVIILLSLTVQESWVSYIVRSLGFESLLCRALYRRFFALQRSITSSG